MPETSPHASELLKGLILEAVAKAKPHVPNTTWYLEPAFFWEEEDALTLCVVFQNEKKEERARHVRMVLANQTLRATYNAKAVVFPLGDPESLPTFTGLLIGWALHGFDVPFVSRDRLKKI